tara:strand:+ start:865 stop:1545 length:681 start_codon:yes stop_codon:yes gene_type:complete
LLSKILVSGCGMSYSKQEKPSWVKVLKICGLNIVDVGGPAVSNEWILNSLINGIIKHKPTHVICQLTATGKLDIESNDERYKELVETDTLRNFTFKGVWPSSSSDDHKVKKDYYKWIYSKSIDVDNTAVKLFALSEACKKSNISLHIIQGYKIDWNNHHLLKLIDFDETFNMEKYYHQSEYYQYHDHVNQNTVPCKQFMKHFVKKINKEFLQFYGLNEKLKKFQND